MMKELLNSVLGEIRPTKEESRKERYIVDKLIEKLRRFEVEPILVGSIAKKTDLRADKDIDLFIMFDADVEREVLEERGLEIGRKVFNDLNAGYKIDYAEHPYVAGFFEGYDVEIVPCYKTKKIKSAVDRTPHHTSYVKKKLRQNKKLRDEILLLKQFMKGIGTYGAESKMQGFSGYQIELLIINYGSFREALEAAGNWRFGELIDSEKLWKRNEGIEHVFHDPALIIIDPVDRYRNAAAAVSRQNVAVFNVEAARFLDKPERSFFFPSKEDPPSREEVRRAMGSRGTKFVSLQFAHPEVNVNSLYSQIRKTLKSVSVSIEKKGFRVMKSGYWTNEVSQSILFFELEVWSLPLTERRDGPPVDKSRRDQDRFRLKHGKAYLEDGRWVADVRRKITGIDELLHAIVAEKKGFGKNLRDEAGVEVKKDDEILDVGDRTFLITLKKFFLI